LTTRQSILGGAFRDTGWLLRYAWRRIAFLSLFLVLPSALAVWLQLHAPGRPFSPWSISFQFLAPWLIQSPIVSLYASSLSWSLDRRLDGGRPSLMAMIHIALQRWPAMLGVQLFTGLAVTLSLGLLVIPGLILASRWLMATQVVAIEGGGVRSALERSAYLTKGRRRLTCGVFVVQVVGYYGVYYAIQILGAALIGPSFRDPVAVAINEYVFAPIYVALYMATATAFFTAFFRRLVATRAPHADVTAEIFS
jgi:hypothetical protein